MADVSEKKRYILFSKEDGRPDSEKPCAFFSSAAGCRNGDKCKFMHGTFQAAQPAPKKDKSVPIKAAPTAAAPTTVAAAPEPKRERESKQQRKERKEREQAALAASAPAAPIVAQAPVASVSTNDKLVKELQQQLLAQQAMMEAQMKLLQQQLIQASQPPPAVVQPVQTKPVEPVRKENKRKQDAAPAVTMPNKSPKTIAPADPVVQNGFGALVQNITQPKATPVAKRAQHQQQPAAVSARAVNTFVNNTQDNDSGDDDNDFLFGAVNHVLSAGANGSNSSTPYKTDPVPLSAASPFVTTEAATKALHTSGSKHALHGSAKKNIFANKTPNTAAAANLAPAPGLPAPVPPALTVARPAVVPFDPTGINLASLPWASLVAASVAAPRFQANYAFQEDATWVKAKPYGAWCANAALSPVLAMDCEMCETTDPVTGEKCDNALVRFSVVDCSDGGKVLIDALVNPGLPITDARTHIHGISEAQITSATWTLRHAQAALLKICSDRTVLVGHSLHKDLRALKFSHSNVVDTAYLFTLENEPGAAPSLRDVAEQVLGTKLSDTHDSVEDAQASLNAAAALMLRGPQPPLIRKVGNPSTHALNAAGGNAAATAAGANSASTAAPGSLLVHRIPDFCTEQHIQEMMVAYTQVMPAKVGPIQRGAPTSGTDSSAVPSGRCSVFFASQIHCDLAFESISGPNRPDKQGRSQKRVYLKGGGYICVRK